MIPNPEKTKPFCQKQQAFTDIHNRLYGLSTCSSLQLAAGRGEDDTIFIANNFIDKFYPGSTKILVHQVQVTLRKLIQKTFTMYWRIWREDTITLKT